ncbi:MAG: ComF family protein [Clostridia bacterium]|nr:ComF family protein [Clostridia bacterium]
MKLINRLSLLIFPPKCASCLKVIGKRTIFCGSCMPDIPFVDGITCEKCGISLSAEFPSPICGRCRERSFHFNKNIPLMEHFGLGREAVLNMKYKSHPVIKDLALLMANRIIASEEGFDVITFVPMTKKEEREKDIHITYFLSREIARLTGKQHKELLCKTRETRKQKELTEKGRIENVRGAYAVKGDVTGKNILIVDDVFTTGATMDECSKVLKRAGAAAVYTATASIRDRE